ncbi:Na/Pi cotransporter [Allostella vacuolata]|nr:Na/Pi cotransporter [Stella vacuolata]
MATTVIIHLLGGVALLLWGLRMVRTGIMRAFGADLRRTLGRAMSSRPRAFASGLGVTALLQSSTATALMVASFAERGLVATAPALAVMLGADVGTALVAQILSVDVTWLSPLLVLLGVFGFQTAASSLRRDLGRAAVGLGLMLLALQLIVHASDPIRDSATLKAILAGLGQEPVLAVFFGALLTWLAHSSLATILLVMSLASSGLIPLPLALAIVLGVNAGAAIPALVATWRGEIGARRVARGNAAFRWIGVALVLPLLPFAAALAPMASAEIGRQVVAFHLAFNLVIAIVFLPILTPVARLIERLLPTPDVPVDPSLPRHLDQNALESPPVAIAAAQREALRMGDALEGMLRDSMTVFRIDDRKLVSDISRRDDVIDGLHEAIKRYLTQISREVMGPQDGKRVMEIIVFSTNLEHVGDIIDKNLMELAQKKIKNHLAFSPEGLAEIADLHARVLQTLKLSLAAFVGGDVSIARRLISEKTMFRDSERKAAERHLERLQSGRVESIETSSLHLDVLRDLKRIHSHLIAVAYPILEDAGELRPSRLATA